ncbi:MAG: polynucleotide 5'-hydroxyl-kinase [Nitrososphaerales archaeon]
MEIRSYKLNKSEVLLVKGPASVKAESKGLSALGVNMSIGEKIIVRKNKVLPFEVNEDNSLVQVTLGEKGESWVSYNKVGVRIWKDLEEKVLKNFQIGRKRIIIIGETDSGKSTLTSYLANKALMRGLKTIIIDGDIGQGDLAPPGCIGAILIKNKIYDLRDLEADILSFLGFTSPRYVRDLVIERMKKIISRIEEKEYDLCIINTDGYIVEEGMSYKVDMIKEFKPDIIICFKDTDKELFRRLKDFDNNSMVIVADRPEGVVKSSHERIERRLSQYYRFLKDGKDLNVSLNKMKLSFMKDFYEFNPSKIELEEFSHKLSSKIYFAKKTNNNKIIVFRSNFGDSVEIFDRFTIFNQNSLIGMFVGLGVNDDVFGFAQIRKLHPNQTITLNTNFKGKFDTLFLSSIRISLNLRNETILPIIRKNLQLGS